MQRSWGTLVVVAVVAVSLLVVAAMASQPPSPPVRAEVARSLEAVLPVLDETGQTAWTAAGWRPGGAEDDPIADAVAGIVPGGRVTAIEEGEGTVAFVVAPQLFGVIDSPLAEWVWTWHAEPVSPGPDDVSPTWTFEVRRPGAGASPSGAIPQGTTGA